MHPNPFYSSLPQHFVSQHHLHPCFLKPECINTFWDCKAPAKPLSKFNKSCLSQSLSSSVQFELTTTCCRQTWWQLVLWIFSSISADNGKYRTQHRPLRDTSQHPHPSQCKCLSQHATFLMSANFFIHLTTFSLIPYFTILVHTFSYVPIRKIAHLIFRQIENWEPKTKQIG